MKRCKNCGGNFYRDYDGLTCVMCARPEARPVLPAWLLQESDVASARQNSDQYLNLMIENEARKLRLAFETGKRVWS